MAMCSCSSRLSFITKGFLRRSTMRPLSTLAANKNLKTIDDLPGYPSYFRLGMVVRVAIAKLFANKPLGTQLLDKQFEDVEKFGSIFKNEFPWAVPMVTLSDPVDAAKVLRNESKHPRRLDLPLLDYYVEKRKAIAGIFFENGEDWYRYRTRVNKRLLKPREVAEYIPAFNDIITDFMTRLDSIRAPPGTDTEYEVKDLEHELYKWSFESVTNFLFDRRFGGLGNEVNPVAEDFIKSVESFSDAIVAAGLLPLSFYKIYKTKAFKDFLYNLDNLYKYADQFTRERIEELEKEGKLDPKNQGEHPEKAGFIEYLMTKENQTKDDLKASIVDLLFAGIDTTSNTMQWFLYELAKNQDKQEKVFQEITQVQQDGEVLSSRILNKMPYLKACFKETLRLYPGPIDLTRTIPTDMEIQGYHLPKGTVVQMLTYYMSRSESNFSEAQRFIPERWLRNEKNDGLHAKHAFASTPFGFGARMCVGRRIAEVEFCLLAVRLLEKYKIQYPDDEIVEPFTRLVIIPDRPVRIKFMDRM